MKTLQEIIAENEANKSIINGTKNLDMYEQYASTYTALDIIPLKNNEIIMVDSRNIHGIDMQGETDMDRFWGMHGYTHDEYVEIASHIPQVQERLNRGDSLESLYSDEELGVCANMYFNPDNAVQVTQCGDTYEANGDGRHRILAASECGYDIPVKVTGAYPELQQEQSVQNTDYYNGIGW